MNLKTFNKIKKIMFSRYQFNTVLELIEFYFIEALQNKFETSLTVFSQSSCRTLPKYDVLRCMF